MKQIKAKIIADSINPVGNRITTFILTFPRFILAELNTHRAFSRNSASSRAIPFAKMVKMVEEDPFIPIAWQKDHKGMQGTEYYTPNEVNKIGLVEHWIGARDFAIRRATALNEMGVTKQLCNRLLEPFMWHTCILTATEFENFFNLRCPQYWLGNPLDTTLYRSKKDAVEALTEYGFAPQRPFSEWSVTDWLKFNTAQAEIHMMELAEAMWDAYNESIPQKLEVGEWHIPFGDNMDKPFFKREEMDGNMVDWIPNPVADGEWVHEWLNQQKRKVSVARCARLSYNTHDGDIDYQKDVAMYDRLAKDGHWSPFEHVAFSLNEPLRHGNLIGWISERTMLENEKHRKEIDAV